MKHLKLYENYKEPLIYTKNTEFGDVYGVIHFEETNVKYWLYKNKLLFDDYIEYIELPMAFLNNINIYDERERGKGNGFKLYDDFEDWCIENGAKKIMLESDNGESQSEGFNLDSWYERLGFHEIGNIGGNKIMIKELESY